MKNKKFRLPDWAKLTLICLVAALSLATTNLLTKDLIELRANEEKKEAMHTLITNAESFDVVRQKGDLQSLYVAKGGNEVKGYIAQTTVEGYGGPIEILMATDEKLTLKGISIGGSEFAETAGLGSKIKEEPFIGQFSGKVPPLALVKGATTNPSEVDQVSGATISSEAVIHAVNFAFDELKKLVP